MGSDNAGTLPVIDFRRQSMVLQWHVLGGTWTACDIPPPLVHGVALIRAAQPNICVYGQAGKLRLQVGADQFALSESSPRIRCTRGVVSFGLRRRFSVESSTGGVLFSHSYWTNQGEDFFRWLAARAQDPAWRSMMGRRWSEGVSAPVLRAA
ncbi:MAG TPA: hypothetical protein VME42_21605 [Steroidobacteraceae bacterium]|nr:hypothetical protein [Steroidobacteraceae bacterium]